MLVLKAQGFSPVQRIARYLPLLPIALIIGCIAHYGVNVPHADDWDLSSLVSKTVQDKVLVKHLVQQHNEHRIFFLKLVVASTAGMSHWDLRLQMYLSVLLCSVTAGSMLLLIRRTLSLSAGPTAALGFLVTVLLFAPIQYENWLWAFQCPLFHPALSLSLSWVLFTSERRLGVNFAWSALLTALATFSFSAGIFGWLFSFPLFVLTDGVMPGRKKIQWLIGWCGAAAACVGLYLVGYHEPVHSTRILTGFHPFLYAEYALIFLGASLFRSES